MNWPWSQSRVHNQSVGQNLTSTMPRAQEHVPRKFVITRLNSVGEVEEHTPEVITPHNYTDIVKRGTDSVFTMRRHTHPGQVPVPGERCGFSLGNFSGLHNRKTLAGQRKGLLPTPTPNNIFGSQGTSMMNSHELYNEATRCVGLPPPQRQMPLPKWHDAQQNMHHGQFASGLASHFIGAPFVQYHLPTNIHWHHNQGYQPHTIPNKRWYCPPSNQMIGFHNQHYLFTAKGSARDNHQGHRPNTMYYHRQRYQQNNRKSPPEPTALKLNLSQKSETLKVDISQDMEGINKEMCQLHISSENVDNGIGSVPNEPTHSSCDHIEKTKNSDHGAASTKVPEFNTQTAATLVVQISTFNHPRDNVPTPPTGHGDLEPSAVVSHHDNPDNSEANCDTTSDSGVDLNCDIREKDGSTSPDTEYENEKTTDVPRCSTPDTCLISSPSNFLPNLAVTNTSSKKKSKKKSRPSAKKRQRLKKQRQCDTSELLSQALQNQTCRQKKQKTTHPPEHGINGSSDDSITFAQDDEDLTATAIVVQSSKSKSDYFCPVAFILGCTTPQQQKKEANVKEDAPDLKISTKISFFISPSDSSDDECGSDSDWDEVEEDSVGFQDDLLSSFLPFSPSCSVSTDRTSQLNKSASSPEMDYCDVEAINARWNQFYGRQPSLQQVSKEKKKSVSFAAGSDLTDVHPIVAWSYAYRAARKGPWETYATDRCRFKNRIREVETAISHVFDKQHRNNIYEKYHSTCS